MASTPIPGGTTAAATLPASSLAGSLYGYGTAMPTAASRTPQVNATNQSAVANNGTVNQSVSNTNTYNNNYYNFYGIQGSPGASFPMSAYNNSGYMYGGLGAMGGFGLLGGGINSGGVTGWLQRLFRGF